MLGEDLQGDSRVIVNNMISIIQLPLFAPAQISGTGDTYPSGISVRLHDQDGDPLTAPPVSSLIIRHNSMYIETDYQAGIYLRHQVAGETETTSNSIRMVGNFLTGTLLGTNTTAPWPVSHHNNVSFAGTNNAFGIYTTKLLIQANTTMEDSSISRVPDYFSKTDLHIRDSSPNINRAFIQPAVALDYDKDPRQYWDVDYDIGADEYDNLGAKSIVFAETKLPMQEALQVNAFPNPTATSFALELPNDQPYFFTLYSTDGRVVMTGTAVDEKPIPVNELPNGTYMLQLNDLPASTTRLVIAH